MMAGRTTTEVRQVGLGDVTRVEVTRYFVSDDRPFRVDAWLCADGDDRSTLVESMDLLTGSPRWRRIR